MLATIEKSDNPEECEVKQPLLRKQSIFYSLFTKAKEKLKSVHHSQSGPNEEYTVTINNKENSALESNAISTSKYTWYNCFPKILIEQFSKMANVYFLIIAIMQSIHEISISAGKPVILLPLSVVVFINGLKDFLEDWKRKVSDDTENRRKTLIFDFTTGRFIPSTWAQVKTGDILKVTRNDYFPADMILLNSSEENGLCYKETKNLDGETNLKFRQANAKIAFNFQDEMSLMNLQGTVITKPPNEFIYEFDARVNLFNNESSPILVDRNSFLLRGCSLRQTDFIWGLVIYTGHNTKIMKNSPSARSKTSKIEHIMNLQIVIIFCMQLLLSLVGAFFYIVWYVDKFDDLKAYIFLNDSHDFSYLFMLVSRLGTWILIFTNLVPISLLVTMEMVKYVQGMFISWDVDMYDRNKRITAKVQTSTLNEELGQVKYIFSDKTGTLTKNYMEFRRMTINGKVYGDWQREQIKNDLDENINYRETLYDDYGEITNVCYSERDNINKITKDARDPNSQHQIKLFFECMALCHSVITEAKDLSNNAENEVINNYPNETSRKSNLMMSTISRSRINSCSNLLRYQASSPDEMCLVNAARFFKYIFLGRDINNRIFLKVEGIEMDYELLHILEYSSERKRMSVIVKCPDGKLRLYTKGADSVIKERLAHENNTNTNTNNLTNEITKDSFLNNKQHLEKTEENLMIFAKEGLRTLMMAYRELPDDEYSQWKDDYLKIMQSNTKDEDLPDLFNRIEQNLLLLGATAIEDQLQDSVGETLDILIKAGVKVWMLTGDKMDTAKSIAFSCKLITHSYNILEIPEKSSKIQLGLLLTDRLKEIQSKPDEKYALLISTDEISKIMTEDSVILESFYQLSIRCHAVVCCRVSPKQKAQMVSLIKKREEKNTTLAIGDGMNDVNMITAAHIGVGIVGVEGSQAARSSDYSIGEFSFLRKLLLVHGRESYRKNSFIVCYNFYKNVLFVVPQFWYGYVSLYSGQTLYDPWIYQLFNMLFASVPIIIFGIYDKERSYKELYEQPKFYTQGIVGKLFHSTRFWKWVILGLIQGFIFYYFSFHGMKSADNNGMTDDLWTIGSMIYGGIVLVANLKILISTNTHSYLTFSVFFLSVLSYWLVLVFMSFYFRFENFNNFFILVKNLWFYLAMLLVVVLNVAIDVGISKLMIYCGLVKDGAEIEAKTIDDHLKMNIVQTNLDISNQIRNKYGGEAFSQEKGQIPPQLLHVN